jgi:hypothetical protein
MKILNVFQFHLEQQCDDLMHLYNLLLQQSRKLAPDRRTVSDKFPDGPVVFVNSGNFVCQQLPLRIDKSKFFFRSRKI